MTETITTKISIPSVNNTNATQPIEDSVKEDVPAPKKRRGRPPKKDIVKNSSKGARPPGRPKGDAAKMNEYKARMLASPKSAKVLESIMNAALDDDHKNQAAAWKIMVDRMIPVSMFEKDVTKGSGRGGITVNITGIGHASVESEAVDADFEEIE